MTFSWHTCRAGKLLSILCGACLLANPGPVPAASALLEWDGVTTDALATWVVYYGVAPRNYTNSFPAGLTNRAVVTTLTEGVTYYFAATARSSDGLESEFSNEVSYTPAVSSKPPTINPPADISIQENSGLQTFILSGITSGSQDPALSITATSSNPQLIPAPAAIYGNSGSTAAIQFKPAPFAFGSAQITVTLRNAANATSTVAFTVQVTPVNQPPTIAPVANLTVAQDSGTLPLQLSGISSGAPNETDPLTLTATSSNPGVVAHPHVNYTSPAQSATLLLTPVSGATGTATITVIVNDGQLHASQTFLVTVADSSSTNTSGSLPNTGLFSGLFHEDAAVAYARSGDFKIAVSTRNTYSGRLRIGPSTLSFSGKLDSSGKATNTLKFSTNKLHLEFQMESDSASAELQGTLTDGNWTAKLQGTKFTWNALTNPAPSSGAYTIVLPGAQQPELPAGHGSAALRVSAGGIVTLSGTLGDRTKITWAGYLNPDTEAPFFIPAHTGKGLVISWLKFADRDTSDISGSFTWIKNPNARAIYYPAGFTLEGNAIGSRYIRPTLAAPFVFGTPDAQIAFAAGTSSEPIINSLLFNTRGLPVNQGTNRMSLTFSTSTGLFTGAVIDPSTKCSLPFTGAILQKQATGYGLTATTNQTASLTLRPVVP